jgi:hypothetical protein
MAKRKRRDWALLVGVGLALLPAGCGGKDDKIQRVDVAGKVLLGGSPMTMGNVVFHPDKGKGNTLEGTATGKIESDGTFKPIYKGKPGVPAGWYKITVTAMGMPEDLGPDKPPPKPVSIDSRYQSPERSGLSVEVKGDAPAGHYDLKLVK